MHHKIVKTNIFDRKINITKKKQKGLTY